MQFQAVYYEPDILSYPLGELLHNRYRELPWIPIQSHNSIKELRERPNADFTQLKRCLILGTRKTHKYTENEKISEYLVPYTSSGCTAACLYCYLVCNYNKCSYLRLFVNREQMFNRLCSFSHRSGRENTYEIGSNSDLILENSITGNLEWTIPAFAREGRGFLTFPTKFDMVDPLLTLDHQGKTLFRMSVNPTEIISRIELGTSSLTSRLDALNKMSLAGYPCGILIAPVILVGGWEKQYEELLTTLSERLLPGTLKGLSIEIIFMTYSYIHRAINSEAFPNAPDLYNASLMTGRGRGKYRYYGEERERAETLLREQIHKKLPMCSLVYLC